MITAIGRAIGLLVPALALAGGCDEPPPSRARLAEPARKFEVPPKPWSDAWMLEHAPRYLGVRAYRRRMLRRSLTNPDNLYSRTRLAAYALPEGGWDALPEWNPRVHAVDGRTIARLRAGTGLDPQRRFEPLWDGSLPTTMDAWVALGERVFFAYPLRPEIFAEHALSSAPLAREVGLSADASGEWPGVVAFADIDDKPKIGITCALCHVAIDPDGRVVAGRARRQLDYGRMRLAFHRDTGAAIPPALAARMAAWGPGRADITQDDDEDPVAIGDLWGIREHTHLTQAGTLQHFNPTVLAIRQETQILHANRERTRPPRALAWALAMYVYALTPPPRTNPREHPDTVRRGADVFDNLCRGCHQLPNGAGGLIAAGVVGTETSLADGAARGTGAYRVAPLVGVGEAAPYLHDGSVASLGALLGQTPDRSVGDGHHYGMRLPEPEKRALIAYLTTL